MGLPIHAQYVVVGIVSNHAALWKTCPSQQRFDAVQKVSHAQTCPGHLMFTIYGRTYDNTRTVLCGRYHFESHCNLKNLFNLPGFVIAFSSSSNPPVFFSFFTKLLTAFSAQRSSSLPTFQPSRRLTIGGVKFSNEVIFVK